MDNVRSYPSPCVAVDLLAFAVLLVNSTQLHLGATKPSSASVTRLSI